MLHNLPPPGPLAPGPVSIVIKALNEEAHIEACLDSALRALQGIGGEVVLADSCSSDATVALARRYPVRIVSLADPTERCCGIGAQLGFEHAHGRFIFVMDGDMQLQPGFLPAALRVLDLHPEVAGVGGQVVEHNATHLEYRSRNEKPGARRRAASVDRLDGGGLYRRSAIESVGYLTDRNLHSYEEFDLGLRLRLKGWSLQRLPIDACSHQGHTTPAFALLARRWRSGYAWGAGELLRAAWGDRARWRAVLALREIRLYLGLLLAWLLLACLPLLLDRPGPVAAAALTTTAAAALGLMSWRKRSLVRGLYALASWHVHAAGLLRGLLRPRRPPTTAIAFQTLHETTKQAPAPAPSSSFPSPPAQAAPAAHAQSH